MEYTKTKYTSTDTKQDKLVSGVNIKTINTNSLLGSGDLSITASVRGNAVYVQTPTPIDMVENDIWIKI